ncbi:hypothetical protein VTP01DRAFT_10339 [Rhizomucor pusillus]|uniref:uncharacterized protein n=1 Tax=Rhizomucor pusillus TaxID=4840 RepID=UPI0037426C84
MDYVVNGEQYALETKRKKNGHPHILGEEHKKVISECIDEDLSAAVKALFQPVDRNSEESVFFDESAFHVNMKRSVLVKERLPWNSYSAHNTSKYNHHLGCNLIKRGLRHPQPPIKRKCRGYAE